MTRLESFRGVPVGTRITVTSRDGFRFQGETASGPFEEHNIAAIRVSVGDSAVYTERLANVSLGWPKPEAAVAVAAVLDPPPVKRVTLTWTDLIAIMFLLYLVCAGLGGLIAWLTS